MQVVRNLGQGGFGLVEEVRDANGNSFARKTFAAPNGFNAEMIENFIKRFQKEVRIQGGISHRNVVPILGSDFAVSPPVYYMPVASRSLDWELENEAAETKARFISIISDIVVGLEELHSMQIFHRDLKPQNVLRFEGADAPYYAISDFGLISLNESRLSNLTMTGMRKTSDFYTAPEITKDLRSASVSSDVYSLGCVLHDLVGTEDRVPCAEIREPGPFSDILLACTRRDPNNRFKSAKSVLDAIASTEFSIDKDAGEASIDYVGCLQSDASLEPEFWEKLARFLDFEATDADRRTICGKLTSPNIREMCNLAPVAANRICQHYCDWVRRTQYHFDVSDAIANRLDDFMILIEFDAKVSVLMALLELGTSHNRWYVERKFVNYCNGSLDENLAKRLAIQFRIEEDIICGSISHLEASIGFDRKALHPRLVSTLTDLC
ncbi:Serine/threonine protein kinase [Yoonia rosea]|uniref:Serine/threonine protein kinase n=1 Tax=Yoonia rosea TaxID=287098 RepID=A0A1R3XDD1_9RHOB|nr:protein kinase [Yoonia rosea]SIT89306.1 Serine/threonine protein kinase [Yoonia rosea]